MSKTKFTGETVELIPNYNNLFMMFLRDFSSQSQSLSCCSIENHSQIHSLLASLNIAVQAIDSTENLDIFRHELSNVVEKSSGWLNNKKQQAEAQSSNCNCDYPSYLGGHHSYCQSFDGYEND